MVELAERAVELNAWATEEGLRGATRVRRSTNLFAIPRDAVMSENRQVAMEFEADRRAAGKHQWALDSPIATIIAQSAILGPSSENACGR